MSRHQVLLPLQGDQAFQALDLAARQEFAEVMMMIFLLQQAVLSHAYVRRDVQMMQQGIDLRTLKPTSASLPALLERTTLWRDRLLFCS